MVSSVTGLDIVACSGSSTCHVHTPWLPSRASVSIGHLHGADGVAGLGDNWLVHGETATRGSDNAEDSS